MASVFMFNSCNNNGDYEYLVTKKNGAKIKVWRAKPVGGMIVVSPPWGNNDFYYLSPQDIERIDYVGEHNINTDK